MPRLRRNYANAPIGTYWLPPDDFAQGLRAPLAPDRPAPGRMTLPLSWRNLIPALMLVAVLYAASVALNWLPYTPYATDQARVQIVQPSPAGLFGARSDARTIDVAQSAAPIRLILKADDQILFEQTYALSDLLSDRTASLFKDIVLSPGTYHVRFQFEGDTALSRTVSVFDRTITLEAGQILMLDYAAGAAHPNRHRP